MSNPVPINDRLCLLIGSIGMLGCELARAGAARGYRMELRADPDALDVTREADVQRAIRELRPDLVINASGYTDVGGAENHEREAYAINRDGPAHLGRACRENDALLVHYSTDYVFNGRRDQPYRVDDAPDPLSVYGASKLAGEVAIRESESEHLIIRTSWLFAPHSRNFVRTIFEKAQECESLSVVTDQVGRPTYTPDLAAMTFDLLEAAARGIVHAGNADSCSWFELAGAIVKGAGLSCEIRPRLTDPVIDTVRRPAYSVLDLSATEDLIGPSRSWRAALAECLTRLQSHDADRLT